MFSTNEVNLLSPLHSWTWLILLQQQGTGPQRLLLGWHLTGLPLQWASGQFLMNCCGAQRIFRDIRRGYVQCLEEGQLDYIHLTALYYQS